MDPAPGQKEKRWYHKLAPPPVMEEMKDGASVYVPGPDKRIDQVEEMTKEFTELKDEVEALRYQLREISDEFKNFRKQFE
jgi:predicted  nucleic acid-binding Zn-ribbon protein